MTTRMKLALIMAAIAAPLNANAYLLAPNTADAQVDRYLESINFPGSMKHSIATRMQQAGSNDATLQHIVQLSDQQIMDAIAPLVHQQITEEQAGLLANFFSMPAVRAAATHQPVTPDQQAQINQFVAQHGDLIQKMNQFFKDPNTMRQILAAVLTVK